MRAQTSAQILASVAIATLMLTLVISYASTQRLLATSEPTPIPATLRHIKADLDSDQGVLFCDAGICINSTHPKDAFITFNLNYHPGFFSNLTNFTGSYANLFNSTRANVLQAGLSSNLASGHLLLSDTATGSNYSLSNYTTGNASLNFNSSSATEYYLNYNCSNTSAITWSPSLGSTGDINFTLTLPGYSSSASSPSSSTFAKVYSAPSADGQIVSSGATKTATYTGTTSQIGISTIGAGSETRSYVSFNTTDLPDDATIVSANVLIYSTLYLSLGDSNPTWNVDYRMGKSVIGSTLTSSAYGNAGFTSAGSLNYGAINGWQNFSIPSGRFSDISLTGQTDFELAPMWASDMLPDDSASITIRQTEYTGTSNDPHIEITYTTGGGGGGQAKLNRSLNYSTSFNTTCNQVNISIIRGNIYSNFSYQNVSFNTTIPTNSTVGVFPLFNKTTFFAPHSSFSSICATGNEPDYPSSTTSKKYGAFPVSGQIVNMVLAERSGSYNTAYFDTNGNCNFTDFDDEYFITTREWIELGGFAARLDSIASDGANATFTFASLGVESTLLKARLVQPIYLNK